MDSSVSSAASPGTRSNYYDDTEGWTIKLLSPSLKAALAEKIDQAHRNAHSAKAYLDSRGITEESTTKFLLGLDSATGLLTIPYLTPGGPWIVKYRCIQQHDCKELGHGKYTYEPGSGIHLFNAQALLNTDLVVLTEGELDAISVDQLGVAGVAYPGTSMWKANPHWRWCFDNVDDIVVVADGDDPGRKAATAVSESLRSSVSADVHLVLLPEGEDSNSYINKFGPTDYLERLDLL